MEVGGHGGGGGSTVAEVAFMAVASMAVGFMEVALPPPSTEAAFMAVAFTIMAGSTGIVLSGSA